MDSARYDGVPATELAARLALPRVDVHARVASTMDLAHAAAESGAPAGTLVIADAQEAGRGRGGARWSSAAGRGLWMTLVERPPGEGGSGVLSLRTGLYLAEALEQFATGPVRLKWPNDLFIDGRKVSGILVEARWRERRTEWVAIGVGINVAAPDAVDGAIGLAPGTRRLDVLEATIPVIRRAAAAEGPFDASELARYADRDLATGRRIRQPVEGVVAGVSADGALLVDTDAGRVACHAGSLVYSEEE